MELEGVNNCQRIVRISEINSVDVNSIRNISANGPFSNLAVKRDNDHGTPTHAFSFEESDDTICSGGVRGALSIASFFVISGLEKIFFRIGHFVGTYPILTIIVCLIMCSLTGLGMKTFTGKSDDDTVWVPTTSRLLNEKKWVDKTFPEETRYVLYLIKNSDNVLSSSVITGMLEYYLESNSFEADGKRFPDLCVMINNMCSVTSLLEIWNFNETVIRGLSDRDIIGAINDTKRLPLSGVEVETLLGGPLTYDFSGAIIKAEATHMTWLNWKNDNTEGAVKKFEKYMIDKALTGRPEIGEIFVYASRSFQDEGYGAINSDINRLAAGFIIVFTYILFALGKYNLMEQKIYLSLTGMLCVGLAILVAYGVGTALSIVYSPIQSILPFLLLGIGVDDMFVIVESWKNLRPEDNELDVPNKIAVCMAHAGVSITVTSVTDVVAFGIGASTVIPALSSFCLYATIGIFVLFCLVSTVFTGVLALDERRRRARRDACICCYTHSEDYQPNRWSRGRSILQRVFLEYFSPFIMNKFVKIITVIISFIMASVFLWRFTQMEDDFDLVKYIPRDSYAHRFYRMEEMLFNREGISTNVYCANFDYYAHQSNLNSLYNRMDNSSYIQKGTINSWFTRFHDYLSTSGISVSSADDYYTELYNFLHTSGSMYKQFIKWNSTDAPRSIKASYIKATHERYSNSKGEIRGMDGLREIIDTSGFPKFSGDGLPEFMCFSYVHQYMYLETNKVLKTELYRNLILAAVAVLLVTIVLVANVWTSVMVFLCVFFTVADVGGVLELWGTTIDTASSVLLTLAVGLAVDYSVHIGHTFMTVEGSRQERTLKTLEQIGPAVFNGGLSTLLAFILLADSASYGFQLFFRVFMSVVLFGIFHGLCLLPVLLSVIGPPSYKASRSKGNKQKPPLENHHSNNHAPSQMLGNGLMDYSQAGYDSPFSKQQIISEEENLPTCINMEKDKDNKCKPSTSSKMERDFTLQTVPNSNENQPTTFETNNITRF